MKPHKNHKKSVLILGISSFLGSSLAEFLKRDYRVYGTYYRNPVQIPGVTSIPCDILSKNELRVAYHAAQPDFVIYCVGVNSVVQCAMEERLAEALNTSGIYNAIDLCQRYKSRFVYLSSDKVFSGEKKKYFEVDIPDPITLLGKTKATAEFFIQKTSLDYLIIRSCEFYGRSISPFKKTIIEAIEDRFSEGKSMQMDSMHSFGFLDVNYLGMVLHMSFKKNVNNRLLQLSSQDQMSYYEFARLYSQLNVLEESLVIRDKWHFPFQNKLGQKVSDQLYFELDTTNIQNMLSIDLPTIEESLNFTLKRYRAHEKKKLAKSTSAKGISFI